MLLLSEERNETGLLELQPESGRVDKVSSELVIGMWDRLVGSVLGK